MFHRVVRKWHKSFEKSICEQLMMRLVALLCLTLLLVGGHSQKTHRDEVNALRSIKRSLIDHYKVLRNWNKGDPCTSNWTGIICYNSTLEDGYLHIRELLLLNSNLSGSLSPEIGRLSYLKTLDFMWNNISGIIPKEIGNITTLELLLLNGNKLSGTLPEEIGNLSKLDRLQVDENEIFGPLPLSLAKLSRARHFHMNNNSLSGDIPLDLHRLPNLVHLLLDNNNLSGSLPPELSEMPSLRILQLDNNNFDGSTIPSSYGNMSRLLKLSLRNCNLQGVIPNWSNMISVAYIDLSLNRLSGSIPTDVLSENITTIDLSNNMLNGSVPLSFSSLLHLQKLSLANNSLNGTISSSIWQKRTLNSSERLILDFENNMFANISGSTLTHPNTTVGFTGNPLCSNANLIRFCGPQKEDFDNINVTNLNNCLPQSCPPPYAYAPESAATHCFCAAPIYIGYRMKSPSFSDFLPYVNAFKQHLSSALDLNFYQVDIDSVAWQEGPRLRMYLKIFPPFANDSMRMFNKSEVVRILEMFGGWKIRHDELFGPFEFLNFTLSDPYKDEFHPTSASGISKGAIVGIAIAAIFGSVIVSAFVSFIISRRYIRKHHSSSRRHSSSRISVTIDGVKEFAYGEMKLATNDFRGSNMVGQGGYGKVYRGILSDGSVVAIKRAQDGSLQGEREFLTEIQLLSRLHHKNLVALVGYCDEEGEQMLIYEFMSNGTLRDHLSVKSKSTLSFVMRVRIALDTARGILYLHTEANPPIFHRDIKATNILLDAKYTAKVADFGLSRLAPDPTIEGAVPDHVSTLVKGTPGYLDPEYFLTHKLTDKSDVYSLGVVFMELLTGMQPIFRGKNLVREVSSAYQSGTIFSIIDEHMGSYPSECIFKFVNLSRRCCNEETESRPSMSEVVRELESILLMLPADSDTESAYTVSRRDRESAVIASSSSSLLIRSYLSENASDLMSGVIPTISPR